VPAVIGRARARRSRVTELSRQNCESRDRFHRHVDPFVDVHASIGVLNLEPRPSCAAGARSGDRCSGNTTDHAQRGSPDEPRKVCPDCHFRVLCCDLIGQLVRWPRMPGIRVPPMRNGRSRGRALACSTAGLHHPIDNAGRGRSLSDCGRRARTLCSWGAPLRRLQCPL
jgi:hypothetical protein